jgi:carboxypeptidase Q
MQHPTPSRLSLFTVPAEWLKEMAAVLALAVAGCGPLSAQERTTRGTGGSDTNSPLARIKDEGLNHSRVMNLMSQLTDVIGPRLTGSPGLKRANEWTRDTLTSFGLANAHLESWGPFGRGWSLRRFSAQVVEPQSIPLIAFPRAWSVGTEGALTGKVIYLDASNTNALEKFRGRLRGAIVLASAARELKPRFDPLATRLTEKELLGLADAQDGYSSPTQPVSQSSADQREALLFAPRKYQFLLDEGAALMVSPSSIGDGGAIFVSAALAPNRMSPWNRNVTNNIPQIIVAAEHYNRLIRMTAQGEQLTMTVDLQVRFHDEDSMAYNTIAEIPGTDLKDEIVMMGAHLDSWHSGTGATDNGAGVAVVMEAARILKAAGLQPRRTVRVGFWTGEEQGLLGSRAYVREHFGRFVTNTLPTEAASSDAGSGKKKDGSDGTNTNQTLVKLQKTAEYQKLAGYFNLDNGTGKIRGVYLQGNESVRTLFRRWLGPFRDMGATTLTIANTGGTDHLSFDAIGLPGFQFIQDQMDYHTLTHHSNMDLYDRISADDMKQNAVIMAAFVYNASTLDTKLPRKPEPTAPTPTFPTTRRSTTATRPPDTQK